MMDSTFKMSKEAFEMTLGLTGTLAFWMGMMKVAEDSGLVQRLAKFLSPVLTKLFPDVPKNHPALGSIFMNYSANMLGLDNAATPIGLKAMQELQTLNTNKDTASNSMIMFLVLNTSGLTIIPVSIMAYRSSNGAADPTDVFIPMLLATMFSSVVGLLAVSVRQRINLFSKAILLAILAVGVLVAGLFSIIYGLSHQRYRDFAV
jgi:spore maturation protein SpmA